MSESGGTKSKASQRADEFLKNFGKAKILILKRIENLKPGDNISEVISRLTVLSNDVHEMSTSLHDATLFLPPYSIKMRQDEIRELEKALKEKEDLLVPKKKFGFKSKVQEDAVEKPTIDEYENIPESTTVLVQPSPTSSQNYLTIENSSDQTLVYEDSQLNRNDVLIRHLTNSTIYLNGSPSTLRLSNLIGCKLICGPVFTSIFIENCKSCTLFLCCQQLRVHSSQEIDIYLRVRSRAIIEDCSKIRFGPYMWDHPKSSELHQLTQINETMERFDCVDDFNWLAFSTPSPNWSLIPEAERVPSF